MSFLLQLNFNIPDRAVASAAIRILMSIRCFSCSITYNFLASPLDLGGVAAGLNLF